MFYQRMPASEGEEERSGQTFVQVKSCKSCIQSGRIIFQSSILLCLSCVSSPSFPLSPSPFHPFPLFSIICIFLSQNSNWPLSKNE